LLQTLIRLQVISKYRTALLLTILAVILVACDEVNFEHAQPMTAEDYSAFPKNLQGNYVSKDSDTIIVTENTISLFNQSNPCDKLSEHDSLGDLIRLRYADGLYFLNIKEHEYWSVLLVQILEGDSAKVLMLKPDDESVLSAIQNITSLKKIEDNNEDILYYVIDPSPKELEQLVNGNLFSPISTLYRIGK
jgi:hypothetical protein